MKDVLLSVIMSVYNGEEYIKQAIESILNQSYKDFEFIIINDGSTDSTNEIIRSYMKMDDRIILMERKNEGLVKSLNDGISLSRAKYIARMDADDISHKDRLKKQIEYLEENREIDVLGTFIDTIGDNEEGLIVKEWFNQTWNKEGMKKRLVEGCIVAHPTVMIRRNVLINLNGYSNKYKLIEDYDLWIRAVSAGYNIANLDVVLLKYRIHNKSKSQIEREDSDRYIKERVKLKLEHFNLNTKKFTDRDVFIWGCGQGAVITYECLQENNIKVKGFVDTYKTGMFLEQTIYNKDFFRMSKNKDFIFIATSKGFKEIETFLLNNNHTEYIYIV